MSELHSEYDALTQSAGYLELSARTTIAIQGNDRQQLLHSFCTADIKSLKVGECCEAFVLDGKGKTMAHVLVLSIAETLLLSTTSGNSDTLISHLDKYIIREDVTLTDVSVTTCSFFVCGEKAEGRLSELVPELPGRNQVATHDAAGVVVNVANVEIAGWGYLLVVERNDDASVQEALDQTGLTLVSSEALDMVRIEQGTPWFGIDIDGRNLPQEVQRDELAISFTKGCYLGQETVARIDAIGRVNQLLVRFEFSGSQSPTDGTVLFSDEKSVGRVTSVAQTPSGTILGLGYVKRAFAKSAVQLKYGNGVATVL